jgi:hypothetical protein
MARYHIQAISYNGPRAPGLTTFVGAYDSARDAVRNVRRYPASAARSYRVFDRETDRVLYVSSITSREFVQQHNAPFGAFMIAMKVNGHRPDTAQDFVNYRNVLKSSRLTPLPA